MSFSHPGLIVQPIVIGAPVVNDSVDHKKNAAPCGTWTYTLDTDLTLNLVEERDAQGVKLLPNLISCVPHTSWRPVPNVPQHITVYHMCFECLVWYFPAMTNRYFRYHISFYSTWRHRLYARPDAPMVQFPLDACSLDFVL